MRRLRTGPASITRTALLWLWLQAEPAAKSATYISLDTEKTPMESLEQESAEALADIQRAQQEAEAWKNQVQPSMTSEDPSHSQTPSTTTAPVTQTIHDRTTTPSFREPALVPLTSDYTQMLMAESISKRDLIRILRGSLERLTPTDQISMVAMQVISTILQAVVDDAGYVAKAREELRQELPDMTKGELEIVRAALLKARGG